MKTLKFKQGDALDKNSTHWQKLWVHRRLEILGYHTYESTEDRLSNKPTCDTFGSRFTYGFAVNRFSSLSFMTCSINLCNIKSFEWWYDKLKKEKTIKTKTMKKDYSKVFNHYDGLQYDNNVHAIIKVHELMEQAGVHVSALTKDKLSAYSDKRPFKVNYFISKVGKTLKWCPTNSPDKYAKMNLKPAEWWIEQLEDVVALNKITANIPDNWLDEQAKHITSIIYAAATKILDDAKNVIEEPINTLVATYIDEEKVVSKYTIGATHYDDLPF